MTERAVADLWQRYFRDELNEGEKEVLARWVNEQESDEDINLFLQKSWNEFETSRQIHENDAAVMFRSILAKAKSLESQKPVAVVRKMNWKRLAVAASVLIAISISAYFAFNQKNIEPSIAVKHQTPPDIKAPATNRAMITLANGQKIFLDSAGNGSLAVQGNVQLVKMANGQIGYQLADGNISAEIIYNTLSNPRGSKVINMALSDGSRVWLNAGSSITYPVAFVGNERKVSITGEAYFEIAHDASKPFYVTKGEMSVRVLGTHFNVNSYEDEDAIRVTLLQGSVNVVLPNQSAKLKPGEQAQVEAGQQIQTSNDVNIDEVMAWKNGLFSFDEAGIKEVMRQVSRWYDVDVVYEGKIPQQKFGGDIERTLSLSQVLEVLEKSNVHFKVEGRKIIVLP